MKERISFKDVPQELMTAMLTMGRYLKTTGLDEKLLELVTYRVSQLNSCAFCLDMHHKDAIHHGETEQPPPLSPQSLITSPRSSIIAMSNSSFARSLASPPMGRSCRSIMYLIRRS